MTEAPTRPSPGRAPRPTAAAELPDEPRRILIVRLSHLGDVTCALPLYHRLVERWPAAAFYWATEPPYAALVEGLARIERAVVFERRGGLRAWFRIRRELRALAPDLAVDAQGNLKSAAVLLASGARVRAGLARADWREPLGARALTHAAPVAPRPHALDRVVHLAEWITGRTGPARVDPELSEAELAAGEARLAALLGTAAAPVLVQLGAPGDPRSWTAEGYRELVGALGEHGRPTLVVAGPDEGELAARLAAALPPAPGRLAHALEIEGPRASAALMAAVARRGGQYVGTDSGPTHLAASVGLPVVLLAGPQDPARTGPWPHRVDRARPGPHRIVLADPGPDCRPCLARHCGHERGPVCTSEIRAADVLAALAASSGRGAD